MRDEAWMSDKELATTRSATVGGQALDDSRALFQSAFDLAPIGMALLPADLAKPLLKVNRALCELLRYPEHGLLEVGFAALVDPQDQQAVLHALGQVASGQPSPARLECRLVTADHQVIWALLSCAAVAGATPMLIAHVEHIGARKHAEQQLSHRALHDSLTGLPNRVLLLDRLRSALARAHRHHTQVAVLFVDLDDFKLVNDSLGHGTGDALLVQAAQRLTGNLRAADTAARLGGDEFVVVCDDPAGPHDSARLAERLAADLATPYDLAGSQLTVTASIGIALARPGELHPEPVLHDADVAMYQAKRLGKNRAALFDDSLRMQAADRLQTESELREALDAGQLRVVYQPIMRLATHAIVGFEALVRWAHPRRGLLEPAAFLQVAEDSGLIVPIGTWVLEQACRQAAAWQSQQPGPPPLTMAVNLSSRQLDRGDLGRVLASTLTATSLDPAALHLELSEALFMEATITAEADLAALEAQGIRLGIDDFGAGYCSLVSLKRFPVTILKIDRSFVAGPGQDLQDAAIVEAAVRLGHALGLVIIAEGIQTAGQLTALQRLGCDLGQGYHLARPQPAQAIARLLEASRPDRTGNARRRADPEG